MKKLITTHIASLAVFLLAMTFSIPTQSAQAQTVNCPAGYTCTPIAAQPVGCPVGFTCTPVNTASPSPIPSSSPTACYTIPSNLYIGNTGSNVTNLQTWLIANGFDIRNVSMGWTPKGYYGNQTAGALARYRASSKYQNCVTSPTYPTTPAQPTNPSQSQSTIQIITPTAGQSVSQGSYLNIQWQHGTEKSGQNVTLWIRLVGHDSLSGGAFTQIIQKIADGQTLSVATSIPSDGQNMWLVPSTVPIGQYEIQVIESLVGTAGVPTDTVFSSPFNITAANTTTQNTTCPSGQTWNQSWGSCTVQVQPNSAAPFVSIVSPNGGQSYTQGQTVPISFSTNLTSQQAPNGFNIWAYFGGNSTDVGSYASGVQNIAMSYTGGSPYSWTVPSSLATGNYVIYIVPATLASGVSSTGLFAFGNSYFTITSATAVPPTTPTISVTAPNGGTYQAGSALNIQWTATGLTSTNNSIGISIYETSLGSPHSILSAYGNNTVSGGQVSTTGSYNWTIPSSAPAGSDYVAYITDTTAGWAQSVPFTITSASSGISGNQLSNLSLTIVTPGTVSAGTLKTTTFNGSFTITAGGNPIYISNNPATAFALSTNVTSATASINTFVPTNGIQSYDMSNNYYMIVPGASRTFAFNGILTNNTATTQSDAVGVTTLYLTGDPTNLQQSPQVSGLQGLNSDFHIQTLLGTN